MQTQRAAPKVRGHALRVPGESGVISKCPTSPPKADAGPLVFPLHVPSAERTSEQHVIAEFAVGSRQAQLRYGD